MQERNQNHQLFVCLSLCLYIVCLLACLFCYLFACLFAGMCVCLFICFLLVCLLACFLVCLFVFICLFVCLFVYSVSVPYFDNRLWTAYIKGFSRVYISSELFYANLFCKFPHIFYICNCFHQSSLLHFFNFLESFVRK